MTAISTVHIESTTTGFTSPGAAASPEGQPDLFIWHRGSVADAQDAASRASPSSPVPLTRLELPRHLGTIKAGDLKHALGRRRARRIIAYLVKIGGAHVSPFPIDRATSTAGRGDDAVVTSFQRGDAA